MFILVFFNTVSSLAVGYVVVTGAKKSRLIPGFRYLLCARSYLSFVTETSWILISVFFLKRTFLRLWKMWRWCLWYIAFPSWYLLISYSDISVFFTFALLINQSSRCSQLRSTMLPGTGTRSTVLDVFTSSDLFLFFLLYRHDIIHCIFVDRKLWT